MPQAPFIGHQLMTPSVEQSPLRAKNTTKPIPTIRVPRSVNKEVNLSTHDGDDKRLSVGHPTDQSLNSLGSFRKTQESISNRQTNILYTFSLLCPLVSENNPYMLWRL